MSIFWANLQLVFGVAVRRSSGGSAGSHLQCRPERVSTLQQISEFCGPTSHQIHSGDAGGRSGSAGGRQQRPPDAVCSARWHLSMRCRATSHCTMFRGLHEELHGTCTSSAWSRCSGPRLCAAGWRGRCSAPQTRWWRRRMPLPPLAATASPAASAARSSSGCRSALPFVLGRQSEGKSKIATHQGCRVVFCHIHVGAQLALWC